jgi:hypothetical protein
MPPRLAATKPYPRTNGPYHQYASVSLTINGVNFVDCGTIGGISDKVERTKVKGLSRVPLGKTAGTYDAQSLKIDFWSTIWPIVENTLDPQGGGTFDAFPVVFHLEIFDEGSPLQTRDFIGVNLEEVSEEWSEGHDPLKVSCTFDVIAMIRNGRNPIVGVDFGFQPNLLQVTQSV